MKLFQKPFERYYDSLQNDFAELLIEHAEKYNVQISEIKRENLWHEMKIKGGLQDVQRLNEYCKKQLNETNM